MQHAQLILELSKAANSHLELDEVLRALSRGLCPEIAFDALSILVGKGDEVQLHALHVTGQPREEGETLLAYVSRLREAMNLPPLDSLTLEVPRSESPLSLFNTGKEHYTCDDLLTTRRFAEEEKMLSYGVRSYIALPLLKSNVVIGAIEFLSYSVRKYTDAEVDLLRDACEIISIAVSNALAYEEIAQLKERLQDENRLLQDEIDHRWMFEEIVGSSAPLRELLDAVAKVAPTDSTVLITGETGTGKELLARAIHRGSGRAKRALVTVNCAGLAPDLVASELFGHEKGAFTGALQRRIGRFESAHGGTIFLDEIGELSPEVQAGLLRVLQEKRFERVGGNESIATDVRVIAATNRDLQQEVNEGRFRQDLYYRLNVFPMHSPALRERIDDIPVLVDYFVGRFARRMGKQLRSISRESIDMMMRYPWPGNIRELQNVLERAVILATGDTLQIRSLDGNNASSRKQISDTQVTERRSRDVSETQGSSEIERQQVIDALRQTRGRVAGPKGAAKLLGVPASTLESRIRAMGIDKFRIRAETQSNKS